LVAIAAVTYLPGLMLLGVLSLDELRSVLRKEPLAGAS
jgi:hypothetical protein